MLRCTTSLMGWLLIVPLGALLAYPSSVPARTLTLREIIVLKNQADLENSLLDGSYRGEAGILRLRPEAAETFGLKAYIDQDYLDAGRGFARAEAFLDQARAAMTSRKEEPQPETHARTIVENYLNHRSTLHEATQSLERYREKLSMEDDDRLKQNLVREVLDRLLQESLEKAENRLRDGLGYFFNASRCMKERESALTPENVQFVNEVFHRFTRQESGNHGQCFGLDRIEDYREERPWLWRQAFPDTFPYITCIEKTVRRMQEQDCETDPLLFLALIRRESNFDPFAVSSAGAAGLTQMMPATALELGVRTVFYPDYLAETGALMDRERRARAKAMATLYGIREQSEITRAAGARALMQKAMDLSREREKLQARYKKELIELRADDRLNPCVAIEFGYRYFCDLMKEHGGDISLALAAYNAGRSRVRDYNGIPPFGETVRFRNRVMDDYRDYVKRLSASPKPMLGGQGSGF